MTDFLQTQLEVWPMAARNFAALENVEKKILKVGEMDVTLQHNPARIRSTAARVDAASVKARPCFLCDANRPPEQLELKLGDEYKVLVNPFPIFDVHFTIPATRHVPQQITADGLRRFADMFVMASAMEGLALFYNGPHCGASAPDHFHFQAVRREELPLLAMTEKGMAGAVPYRVESIVTDDCREACRWLADLCRELSLLPENAGEPEPRMNILCTAVQGGVLTVVIPRRAHRPAFYGTGIGEVLVSPASVDLSGVVVVPSAEDFHSKITPAVLSSLFAQTCYAECRNRIPAPNV